MELTRKEIATAIIKQYKKDRNSTMLDLADAIIRAENKRKPTIVIPAVKVDGRRKFFGYGEVLHVLRRRGDKQTICGYSINEMLPESKRHWKKHLCLACFKKQTLKP